MIGGSRKSLLTDIDFDAVVPNLVAITLHVFDNDFICPDRKLEDPMTDKLVFALLRYQGLEVTWFSVYTISGQRNEYDPATESVKGRTDISFELGGLHRFVWECKLLRHKKAALYAEYRAEGVMRFVNQKYTKGESHGGMLAYVMDGKISKAVAGVRKSLNDNSKETKLTSFDESEDPKDSRLYESHHDLGHDLKLYHGFLDCNSIR